MARTEAGDKEDGRGDGERARASGRWKTCCEPLDRAASLPSACLLTCKIQVTVRAWQVVGLDCDNGVKQPGWHRVPGMVPGTGAALSSIYPSIQQIFMELTFGGLGGEKSGAKCVFGRLDPHIS